MIDLHSHILPAVDDGSRCVEESVEMLYQARAQGTTLMVATPHFYPHQDTPQSFLQRRKEALEQIPYDGERMPKLLLGAEVAYFGGISGSRDMQDLCIGNSRLLLVEMPFRPWSMREVEDVCGLHQQGIIPVLAHIDRYGGPGQLFTYLPELLQGNVLFQCNGSVFLKLFAGRWLQLLRDGYIAFLGSDCHNLTTRPPMLHKAEAVLTKKLGAERFGEWKQFSREMLG